MLNKKSSALIRSFDLKYSSYFSYNSQALSSCAFKNDDADNNEIKITNMIFFNLYIYEIIPFTKNIFRQSKKKTHKKKGTPDNGVPLFSWGR